MKVSTIQYSELLYELTVGKSQQDVDDTIVKFTALLIKNGQIKIAGKIIKKFSEIYNQKNGIAEAEVTTSRKMESHQFHKVESFVKEKYKAKKVVINNKIDENIKGGIVVKVGDEVVDASLKSRLINLNKLLKV